MTARRNLTTRNGAERDLLALHRRLTPQMQRSLGAWAQLLVQLMGTAPVDMKAVRRAARNRTRGGAR